MNPTHWINEHPLLRRLGLVDFIPTWHAMQAFTASRGQQTQDEVWLLEHSPVFTLGQASKPEHVIKKVGIPLVPIDRGGQVTYHGPGQVVVYLLLDLRRRGYGVKELVNRLEQAVIDLLASWGIAGDRLPNAPGVYVSGAKIGALGLRIRHGCSYHGLALNVDMDLTPFAAINPCGYAGMRVTQVRDLGIRKSVEEVGEALLERVLLNVYDQESVKNQYSRSGRIH